MKKIIKYSITTFILLILITGCGKKKDELMTCSKTSSTEDSTISVTYKITYSGEYVKAIDNVETLTSKDKDKLTTYKEQLESIQGPYDEVEYYTYKINLEGETLTNSISIDYEKVNRYALIFIDPSAEELFTDGKVLLSTIKEKYEGYGLTCTK